MGKTFEKQTKTIEAQGKKEVVTSDALKSNTQELTIKNTIREDTLNYEAKNEFNKKRN